MSAPEVHSLGPTCAYFEEEPVDLFREGSAPPKIKAQFFYISSLPIDDPLSPLPPVQSEKTAARQPPQPFSSRDNAALEEAWQGFQKGEDPSKGSHSTSKTKQEIRKMFSFPKFKGPQQPLGPVSPSAEGSDAYFAGSHEMNPGSFMPQEASDAVKQLPSNTAEQVATRAQPKPKQENNKKIVMKPTPTTQELSCEPLDHTETQETIPRSGRETVPREQKDIPPGVARDLSNVSSTRRNQTKNVSETPKEPPVMLSPDSDAKSPSSSPIGIQEACPEDLEHKPTVKKRRFSPFRSKEKEDKGLRKTSPDSDAVSTDAGSGANLKGRTVANGGSDISGRPFARAPSQRNFNVVAADGTDDSEYRSEDTSEQPSNHRSRLHSVVAPRHQGKKQVFIPVGVSRLHLVEFPDLVMKPIYWQAINDKSSVIRATWFFKESMLPVPAEVANRLEIGYEDMKPFTETYQDELTACVENGAIAELKVVHKLWPDDKKTSRPTTATDLRSGSDEISGVSANVPPELQENAAADARQSRPEGLFETCSVVYVNGRDAQILKSNQLPSESRGRRPLNSIRKGRHIGVAVVRGFDRKEWRELYPDARMDRKAANAALGAYMSQSGDATTQNRHKSCAVCEKENRQNVSDLVLVIHGIGQKLSERVDSFHFTHAINGLRREFNVELASEAVKGNLRSDSGIMVLPVNWRLTVSFDDEPKSFNTTAENSYSLADITPETLPGVRSLISDVLLDIPFYLSHHKQKMTAAVIKEANRVYRLWCRNNPGFQEHGRVHLVAHSLGSAMAMDILSQQPTAVPDRLDLTNQKVSDKMFEFNTTNLFCCGSPSGFFLLLNGANLIPRKGRDKPGMEGEDRGQGIAKEASTFGCLSVDNVYNIMHRNDPVSYGLNACVDKSYAASLLPATIPTASPSLFARVGNTLRLTSPSAAYGPLSAPKRPGMQSLPSTVEMATHDFTREEIAEKRMYLLNENGQIDYFLNSGGGPLEIQYLNMLSAHSSYWILQDFVRFLVLEVGRTPGREGTLPVLRAQKKREYKKGSIV